jgi:hypothetical protein
MMIDLLTHNVTPRDRTIQATLPLHRGRRGLIISLQRWYIERG